MDGDNHIREYPEGPLGPDKDGVGESGRPLVRALAPGVYSEAEDFCHGTVGVDIGQISTLSDFRSGQTIWGEAMVLILNVWWASQPDLS